MDIQLYDTTLRDGMQGEGMSLSADEKLVELNDDVDSDMAALDGINLSGMERGEF